MKEVNATDSARKLAEDNDIDLSEVVGTGAEGRILKKDVEALLETPKEVVEETEVTVTSEPKKAESVSLSTSFRLKTRDGDRLEYVFTGTGNGLKEAIDNLSCISPLEEEGKDFPAGINLLVNATVKRGDYTYSRALAPHVAKATLSKKEDTQYLEKLLGLR